MSFLRFLTFYEFITLKCQQSLRYEESARKAGYARIAGVDEVGRGALAGPVYAAAVVLPEGFYSSSINDSKKLSEKQREEAFEIIQSVALEVALGWVEPAEIDKINIYQATRKSMELAIRAIDVSPDYLLVDAMTLPNVNIPQEAIKKGDAKSISIAAASIVAKVTRDRLMTGLDSEYPLYGFARHKGYGTLEHRNALKKYGFSSVHRVSYKGVVC